MQDTRTAIALQYTPESGQEAPRIVASGEGYVADEILRIARENDVPLRPGPGPGWGFGDAGCGAAGSA